MKSFALGAALACALALNGSPAWADETVDAVHCYIVHNQMASSPDPTLQSSGMIGAFYWIGRMDTLPQQDHLPEIIATEMANMTVAQLASEAQRCGAILVQRGQKITEMEKAVRARVEQIRQNRNSH